MLTSRYLFTLLLTRTKMKKKLDIGGNYRGRNNDIVDKKYRRNSGLDADFVDPLSEKKKLPNISFLDLFRFASSCDKVILILGILCTVATAACQPFNMLNFGTLADTMINYAVVLASGNVTTEASDDFFNGIIQFATFNCIIGAVSFVFTFLQVVLFNYAAINQSFKLRDIYFEKVLEKDVGWYDTNQTGDFASRISEDLNKYEDGIGEKVVLFLHMVFTFIGGLAMALVRGWELALICIASLPVSIIIVNVVTRLTARLAKREMNAYAAAGAIAEEVLSTIRTVVAFGGQNKEIERYEEQLIVARKNNIRRATFFGLSMGLLWFLIYCSYALAFWYGVGLVIREMDLENPTYTGGNMITVFFSVMQGTLNLAGAAPYLEAFGISTGAGAKVMSVIDEEPVINKPNPQAKKLDKVKGRIIFKNVHFSYPSRPSVKVLRGVDLTVERGQTVALVGSSGCGKSTCIQLMQRFYDPLDGEVQLDGVNIKDLDLHWLRSNFGVVGQEPVLFGTTISENIRYGNMSATQEDIERAAKKANAHRFIMKLPEGYNTLVGERGAQLSGGQKQRIAIARALVSEPTVLLLDEATSALDTNSEAKVQAALDAASKSCTTIIVAHRLSTIRAADKIFVFSDGQIVEEGTHEELMRRHGHYYTLVVTQVSGPDLEAMESAKGNNMRYDPQYSEVEQDDLAEDEEIPVQKTKEVKPNAPALLSVIKMNSPEWWQITLGCLMSTAIGAAGPVFAVLFGSILGVLSSDDPDYIRSETNMYSLFFVALAVAMGVASFIQIPMYTIAGERLVERLRKKMFVHILEQEMGWFDDEKNGVGKLCSRLSSEASNVQGATGQRIGTIFQSVSTLGLAIGLSLYYEWRLGLVAMAFTPFTIFFQFMHARRMKRTDTGSNEDSSLENSVKIAVEAVSNIRTVASLGMEKDFHALYIKTLLPYHRSSKRGLLLRGLTLSVGRSLMFFAFAVCMYYGGMLVRDEGVDYANVFKVCQALIMGTYSLAFALAFAPNFQKGLESVASISDFLNREPKIKDAPNASSQEWEKGDIRYSKIEFRYPTRPNVEVLKGLDLSVLNGKTVALVGPSGCGKSTLIQLLERFYDPTKGQIDADGTNIKEMQLRSLRSHLGIVSQEPNLFDRTIAENIAYGDNSRKVSQEEIIEAAKKANIHNFICTLPLGYDTRLGERGVQLSGGQKQRVAIARALIRNPKVLLLDEATSALDNESEKVVQSALDAAREGRTCITIAHRLTTIKDADVICVINDGIIAEMGTHHQLLKQKGLYEKLYSLQMGPTN